MKTQLFFLSLFAVLLVGQDVMLAQDAAKNPFDVIMQRIQASEWENVTTIKALDARVAGLLSTIQDDGSWADIPLTNRAQTGWLPINHLNRVKNMVLAYTLTGSAYKDNPDLYTKISAALELWHTKNPTSTNWYYQQIGTPQRVGIILILLRAGAKQEHRSLETNMLNRMKTDGGRPDQSGSLGTGANKIDIATHWVYRACLTENADDLEFGTTQVYLPVAFTTGEGLQNDFSYQQHGPQFYTGGYGQSYIRAVTNMVTYTAGTPYAIPDEKLAILNGFTQEYARMIRGNRFLYNVLGRGNTRKGGLNQSLVTNTFKETPKKHTHYYRSDYTLYTSPEYTFDVRMVSTRTYRNENGNDEGLKGYFLADGATTIVIDGDEYLDIFPTWDWSKIPGVTAPQRTSIPRPAPWGTYGKSTFAGGVSDSIYGVTAFAYTDPDYGINTSAKKAWFFFGNEVVCLGANIQSTAAEVINTTVNQTLLKGDVIVSDNMEWVWHNKIGYVFPEGGNLKLSNNEQSGTWKSINTSQASDTVKKDVFTLWFDHGIKPANANYAYIVVPNVDAAALKAYDKTTIEIVVNSDTVQAVRHKALGITELVFYKAATYTNGNFTLTVDTGCALILKDEETANIKVHGSDPSQSAAEIKLRVVSPAFPAGKKLVVALPEMPFTGASVPVQGN
ncbi:MAG: polysaccharide lyase 8 family protein [Candidatus Symbiothrix sp.]|jgi:chondroitin AC lyase|nr:polysaccharide lyase 8 family protein [Candidatus Symbiothrix sp.]